MRSRGAASPLFYFVLLTLSVSICLCDKEENDGDKIAVVYPRSSSLIASPAASRSASVADQAHPEAPYWLKPEQMERQLYAEPLNTLVRKHLYCTPHCNSSQNL